MTEARELSLALPHLRLSARAWGDPSLPPLLALHGWLDNAASFDRLAPLLSSHFHIVALDLPGHGRSDHRPPGVWYHYVDFPGDVLTAIEALRWPRFSLLGHSLGGAITAALAAAVSERVDRLFLIEALGPLATTAEQTVTLLKRAISQRNGLREKSLRVFGSVEEAAAARAQAGDLSTNAARVLVERGIQPVDGGFVWSSDPRLTLTSPQRYIEPQIQALLAGIVAPTLLILAQPAPSFLPEAVINPRIACIRDIEVERLPGHHHLHLEDPEPVARTILSFNARKVLADAASVAP